VHVVPNLDASFKFFFEHQALLIITILEDGLNKPIIEQFLSSIIRFNIFLLFCELLEFGTFLYMILLEIKVLVIKFDLEMALYVLFLIILFFTFIAEGVFFLILFGVMLIS
jgi:hypothetical protein